MTKHEINTSEQNGSSMYQRLGIIAQADSDFVAAEQWYRKALAIKEKCGNEHGAAITYLQFGVLAGLQDHFLESGRWLIRAIVTFIHQQDAHFAKMSVDNFLITYRKAPLDIQAQLRQLWEEAGLGVLPEDGNPP
ncbi:MAG: hypothetical protein HC889_05420 [Synechococcaceae cyanobacterium SM1_2_3]|nr:hypothetical protein [Synechococcaceae cyanobacterium SM1_2_3]